MTKFLTILFTAAILQAHMITDAFLGTSTTSPDSTATFLLKTTAHPYITPTVDSQAPNNLSLVLRDYRSTDLMLTKLGWSSDITGFTVMSWLKLGNYQAFQVADTNIRGFCVTRNALGGNTWGDTTRTWIELNKTRTQLTMIFANYTRPSQKVAAVWTYDSIKSKVFAPLDTNKFHMIGYTYPLLPTLVDTTLIKITFYVNGVSYGIGTKSTFYRVCNRLPQSTTVGGILILRGTTKFLENPMTGYASGGAITYTRELTAAQIKAVYDTNQTHNLRYQRSLTSALELATAKAPSSINCMSINPTAVQFPGSVLQVISVEGRVLHTLQNTTGKVILPNLSAGRYFLKADYTIKPIFILN